jgi:hypothetical protein
MNENDTPEAEFTEDLPGQSGSSLHLKKKNPWRRAKEIDVEKVKEFLAVNMPVHRIAQYFGTTKETLYNKFGDIIIESNVNFEHQLRLAQVKAVNELNPTMLIWMGKNLLNQVDSSKQTLVHEGKVTYDAVESKPEIIERPE